MEGILVPLAAITMPIFIVGFAMWSTTVKKKATLDTVKEAIRSGQQLSPDTIKALGANGAPSGNGDLKAGGILIAVALAFLVLGVVVDPIARAEDSDAPNIIMIMAAIASFPGFIGIVLFLFGAFKPKNSKD